jgi:sugar lactone lactonase YvrE
VSAPECVVDARNILGESPVWCGRSRRLRWVDSRAPALWSWDPTTGVGGSTPVDELIGSIGLRARGGLVAALRSGFHTLDPETGAAERIAAPEAHLPDNRFNDGRVDAAGRFWAGTMSDVRREPAGSLYRLDADHGCHRILEGVIVPNSIAWSPDSSVMYFADTYRARITAYDFDLPTGTLHRERLFRDTSAHPGRPDGSAVDEDGCLWNAEYAGARVVRYTPAGDIDRVIELPVPNPTCCTFGGDRLDTLFVTSASQRLARHELARHPLSGALFAVVPGVKGLPEHRYAG